MQKDGAEGIRRVPSLLSAEFRSMDFILLVLLSCAHSGVWEGSLSKALAFPPSPSLSHVCW